MADEYVEDPDPEKEDCKVEDDDPKDVCKDKPTGVEEGGPEEEQPKPDSDGAFKPDDGKPDDGGGGDEPPTDTTPTFIPAVAHDCKYGWYYDDDLERCVDMRCDPDFPDFYDAEKCCMNGETGEGYVDQLCRDICDPEADGYDIDMCCDLESPWYDAGRCETEVEPVIEPEDPEDDDDLGNGVDPVVVPDDVPPGKSKCSLYINDGALEGLPGSASAEETKMFDLINAYRVSKGLSEWKWNPELHLACASIGLFKLGAENTPEYENDYDKTRFGSLKELVMYYGYHNPVAPEYKYYKGPKPDADFIWGQTIDPAGKWGLKRALDALPGYVDCAVALVKNKSWVWMTAKGNECKETDEEDPDEIDPGEVIDGGDELFDPAITGTECDVNGPKYNAEWVWDDTDKKCKEPGESKPAVEDPDEINPDETIDGGDELFEPPTEVGTKCDPNNPDYDDTLEWDPDTKECRKKEGVVEPTPEEPDESNDGGGTYTNGAELPPGFVNPILGTECDAGKGNDKYDPTFEWNQATKECKKRKEPEPETNPEETEPGTPVDVVPLTEPEPVRLSWKDIPCYTDDGLVVDCGGDPDPLVNDDGDLDDDGVKDDVDLDDDNDGVVDVDDPRPDLPEPVLTPIVDPDPVVTPDENVVEFLGAKAVARNIAFILDRSESMAWDVRNFKRDEPRPIIPKPLQRWTLLKKQVERVLNELPPDARVWVGFFSGVCDGGKEFSGWDPDYIFDWFTVGDPYRGKDIFLEEMNTLSVGGCTEPNNVISRCFNPSPMQTATEIEPDVVFFLSDGGFTYKPYGAGQVKKHFLKKNLRDRARLGKAPIITHTFSIVDRGGASELQEIVGGLNKAMGFSTWKGPNTYRHVTYETLIDMQDLIG